MSRRSRVPPGIGMMQLAFVIGVLFYWEKVTSRGNWFQTADVVDKIEC